MSVVSCRAQLEDDCYDGRSVDPEEPPESDGTYKTEGPYEGTIVCDACYVRLIPRTPSGQALNDELHPAINAYHAEHPRERYPLARDF